MLTIAISARSLFNIEDGHKIFQTQGEDAFDAYMREKENVPLRPGVAFNLIKKLLALNTPGQRRDAVEVVLLSRNSPDGGIRVMNSVMHYGLNIETAVFTRGHDRFQYAREVGAHLFLSANSEDVQSAVRNGVPAATLIPSETEVADEADNRIVIAFDGDSVLFSDEAERINQIEGLPAFQASEQANAHQALPPGPVRPMLEALVAVQRKFSAGKCPLEIALVTARGVPAHRRVLYTLRSWGLLVDAGVFAGGKPKGPFLKAMRADLFLDDTPKHVNNALSHGIMGGHVPYGVVNDKSTQRPPASNEDPKVVPIANRA